MITVNKKGDMTIKGTPLDIGVDLADIILRIREAFETNGVAKEDIEVIIDTAVSTSRTLREEEDE